MRMKLKMAYPEGKSCYAQQLTTTTNMAYSPSVMFPEEDSSKYRCCCDSTRVSTGAKIICIFQIICCGFAIIGSLSNLIRYDNAYNLSMFITTIISSMFQITASGLMLYGIRETKSSFILPELIFKVIGFISLFVMTIIAIIIIANRDDIAKNHALELGYYKYDSAKGFVLAVGIILLLSVLVNFALSVWFFMVILRCYHYIRAKNQWLHTSGAITYNVATTPVYQMQLPQYGAPQPTPVYHAYVNSNW